MASWQQGQQGSTSGSSKQQTPGMQNMKYEIANEIGVNLKQGYNGDLTSRQAGYVGGFMVKRMIEQAERSMAGK